MFPDSSRPRTRRIWSGRLRFAPRAEAGLGSGSQRRPSGDGGLHYVVCGKGLLLYRLVDELRASPGARVTAVVPAAHRAGAAHIATMRGVRVITADRLDAATFRAVGLAHATGLAIVHSDDVGNIHAALCAQEVNPDLRLVIRMYNTSLAHGVRRMFADCAALSDAAMAAPAFVAAALGEVAPTHFRLAGRTLHVARRADVPPGSVLCGLADTRQRNRPHVLPADSDSADLVLAEAGGQPVGTVLAARRLARSRRGPFAVTMRALRALVHGRLGLALLATAVLMGPAGAVLADTEGLGFWESVYFTVLTAVGGAEAQRDGTAAGRLAQLILTVGGLALIPLLTAAVVDRVVQARLAVAAGRQRLPRAGHMVVVGLGAVGTRVIRQLHDLGVEVVAIDKSADARGAPVARQLEIPLIVGDAAAEETLRAALVETCQALVVLSTDDVTNLQAALTGRALREDLRVVLRLYDGDLADRIERAFDIAISRSVSYLAAPAFAAQLTEREVLATIPVERHVLLVAEVPIAHGSAVDGAEVGGLSRPDRTRVIALTRSGRPSPIWNPPVGQRVAGGDRLLVVARRRGLNDLVSAAGPTPAPSDQPAG